MEKKLAVFIFCVMIMECYGHHSILGNILSTAHERVHTGFGQAAGSLFGGLNIGGNFGFNKQHRPPPQRGPDETIIVVVEEPNENNYRPPNTGYRPDDSGQRPQPNQNHHHQQRPQEYPTPEYNNQNQGPHNGYQNNQNPGNSFNGNHNQNGRPSYNNENSNNNGYSNNNNNDHQSNQNHQTGTEQHHGYNNNQNKPYDDANVNQVYNNPTTEYVKTTEFNKPKADENNKGTEKSTDDDFPLFVPLNPNEYVYGGDKINITAPKRETEKSKSADDDDFPIDVRLKN